MEEIAQNSLNGLGDISNILLTWLKTTGIKVVFAIILLIVCYKLINLFKRRIMARIEKNKRLDKTISETLCYIGSVALKVLVVICLVGYLGIDTSGLTALVTSLGVCAGLAVNGALSNLAGGLMILISRPFKVGDYVLISGYEGTVENIYIINTKLKTKDGKSIYIPNSVASSTTVTNFFERDTRRVDLTFSIGYNSDFRKAEAILAELTEKHEKILKTPAPVIRMSSHSASSIDIICRPWVKSKDYWSVYFDLLEQVKERFDAEGIEIPFQQVDVHVKQ